MAILKVGSNIVPDMYVVSGQEGAKQMNEDIDLFIVMSFTLVNETRKCLFFLSLTKLQICSSYSSLLLLRRKKKSYSDYST